jgi:ribonuclease BN (tRNA processing enzyme)
MRLTVLGGSAAGPNPGQGCSGYLVETGTTRLVLDLGPGTLPELRRHTDYRTLSGIVISHLHVDHVLDLVALRYALAYNPVSPPGAIPLWMPLEGRAFLQRVAGAFAPDEDPEAFFGSVFAIAEYEPDEELQLGDTAIGFSPTVHYIPCWAMNVRDNRSGQSLAYTADTGPAADLSTVVAGASVLVADAGNPTPEREPFEVRGHATAAEMAQVARAHEVTTLVLAHLWQEEGFARYAAAAAREFSGRIEVAQPGLTVEW